MMPLISSISGGGKLQSDEVTLLESVAFERIKEVLKLGENYTNIFKDLNLALKCRMVEFMSALLIQSSEI
jgi:hypothetical protein